MHNILILAISAIVFLASSAGATLLDDFSDGDDAGWIHLDGLTSGGPGIFDASSGSYVLSSTSAPAFQSVTSFWEASIPSPVFSNGVLTARVRMDNVGTRVGLVMRAATGLVLPGPGAAAYAFGANNTSDVLFINRTLGSIHTALALTSFPITDGTEYWLSAYALDSELSLKFWEVGTPEPLAPLLSASDSAVTSGAIGLVAFGDGTRFISASFDDVQFVPEPGTGLLLASGLLGLAIRRRTH